MDIYSAELSGSRDAVHEIMAAAINSYDASNPAQLFADCIMAMSIMAQMFDADVSDVQPAFDEAVEGAISAASKISVDELMEELDQ